MEGHSGDQTERKHNCVVCGSQIIDCSKDFTNTRDKDVCKSCSDSMMSSDFLDEDNFDTTEPSSKGTTNQLNDNNTSSKGSCNDFKGIENKEAQPSNVAVVVSVENPSFEENDEFDTSLASIDYNPQVVSISKSESVVPIYKSNPSNKIQEKDIIDKSNNISKRNLISHCLVCSVPFATTVQSPSHDVCSNCQADTLRALFETDDDNNDIHTTTDKPNLLPNEAIMVTQDDDESDEVPKSAAYVTPSPHKDRFDNNLYHQEINETKRQLFPSSNNNHHDEFDHNCSLKALHENHVSQPVELLSQQNATGGETESAAITSKKRAIDELTQSRPGCCADCNIRFNPDERWKKVCSRCYRTRMETIEKDGLSQEMSSNTNTQQGSLSQSDDTLDLTTCTDTNSVRRAINLLTPSRPGCCADCNRRMTTDEKWKKVCNQCYRKRMDVERARIRQEKSSKSDLHNDVADDLVIASKSRTAEVAPSLCIVCQKPTSKKNHQYCLPCYREQEAIEASQAQKPTSLPNVVQLPSEYLQMSCKDRIRQRRVYVCIDCGTIVPENWMIQCKVCYVKRPISKTIINSVYNEQKKSCQYMQRKKFRRG